VNALKSYRIGKSAAFYLFNRYLEI